MTSMCPLLDVLVMSHNRRRADLRRAADFGRELAEKTDEKLSAKYERATATAEAIRRIQAAASPASSTAPTIGPMINVETFNDPLGFNRER